MIRRTRMYQFQQKLKILKSNIKKWNTESFGNIFQAKLELDSKIKEVQTKGMLLGFTTDFREQESFLLQEFNQREH